MAHVIDYTAWEYGGDVCCPNCMDESLYFSVYPVWATDQCELYEVMCPICGVIDVTGDTWDNEFMDQMNRDVQMYTSLIGNVP